MTLGNYTGTDGLRIKDFPEMRVYLNLLKSRKE
jgi:hypothetical protein